MSNIQPWATCLLTGMLIRHLETRYPDRAGRVDYRTLIHLAEGGQDIPDPRAFLLDPNNWVPYTVLRELIRQCEEASGEKDFAYQAALAHYEAAKSRAPTLLETIAMLLSDVELVLRSAYEWASGYTNYLQLQAFARPREANTLHLLSRFIPPVDILLANARFVQGNIEGIAKLDTQVESVSCEEAFSQVRLASLVAEFGERYQVTSKPTRVTVTDRSTRDIVLTARPISLMSESVLWQDPSPQGLSLREDQMVVCPDSKGYLTVYAAGDGEQPSHGHLQQEIVRATALRIERGGTLFKGPLTLTIPEGAIYDAPYSRYRIQWRKRTRPPGTLGLTSRNATGDTQRFAHLLFDHLKSLQATHRRNLSMVIRNLELTQENIQLKQELVTQQETGGILGKSPAIQDLLALIQTVAATDATVLIT